MQPTTFLSYSHADQAAANALHCELAQAGVGLFQDCIDLRSGDRCLTRLQQALAACVGVVVLVGRDGVRRWVAGEVEVALNRHFSAAGCDAPALPIHVLLLPGAKLASLPPLLQLFQATTWEPGQPLDDGLAQALREHQTRFAPVEPFEGCPYQGLASFNTCSPMPRCATPSPGARACYARPTLWR